MTPVRKSLTALYGESRVLSEKGEMIMKTMADRVAEMAWCGMHILEAIEALDGKAVRRDCRSATTYYSMPDGSELWVADCGDWDIVSENEIGEGEELGRLVTYWDQTASQKAAQAAWHVE